MRGWMIIMSYEIISLVEALSFLVSSGLAQYKGNNIYTTNKLIECTEAINGKCFIHFVKNTEEYMKGNYYEITKTGFKKEVINWV